MSVVAPNPLGSAKERVGEREGGGGGGGRELKFCHQILQGVKKMSLCLFASTHLQGGSY